MSSKGPAFIRARQPEQKQQRYRAILDAARELAVRDGIGEVSLGNIATRIGMHKSALLKYFGTREEIFLRLGEEEWQAWSAVVVARLDGRRDDPAEARQDGPAEARQDGPAEARQDDPAGLGSASERRDERWVSDTLVDSIAERPLLCQLLVYSSLSLERNVSLDAVRSFKSVGSRAITDVSGALHRALRTVSSADCTELLTMGGVVAAGLWQAAHPPPVVEQFYAEESAAGRDGGPFCAIDFAASLRRFFQVHLAGLRHSAPMTGTDPSSSPSSGPSSSPSSGPSSS